MERMQSTWENLVDYDMSESGVRPLTLRELVEMGFDLEAFLDQPLGYSQSNGTIELRERLAAIYPGATSSRSKSPTAPRKPTTSSPSASCGPATKWRWRCRTTCRCRASRGASARPCGRSSLRQETGWEPDWDEFERAVTPPTRLLYLSNPNNPTGSILSRRGDGADRQTAARRPARGFSPTRCISARKSTARARRASGA